MGRGQQRVWWRLSCGHPAAYKGDTTDFAGLDRTRVRSSRRIEEPKQAMATALGADCLRSVANLFFLPKLRGAGRPGGCTIVRWTGTSR